MNRAELMSGAGDMGHTRNETASLTVVTNWLLDLSPRLQKWDVTNNDAVSEGIIQSQGLLLRTQGA